MSADPSGVQSTSLFTYRNEVLPTFGDRQKAVYDELAKRDNMTNSEIGANRSDESNDA